MFKLFYTTILLCLYLDSYFSLLSLKITLKLCFAVMLNPTPVTCVYVHLSCVYSNAIGSLFEKKYVPYFLKNSFQSSVIYQ